MAPVGERVTQFEQVARQHHAHPAERQHPRQRGEESGERAHARHQPEADAVVEAVQRRLRQMPGDHGQPDRDLRGERRDDMAEHEHRGGPPPPIRRSSAVSTRAKRKTYEEVSPPTTHRALATRTSSGVSPRCATSVLDSRSTAATVPGSAYSMKRDVATSTSRYPKVNGVPVGVGSSRSHRRALRAGGGGGGAAASGRLWRGMALSSGAVTGSPRTALSVR